MTGYALARWQYVYVAARRMTELRKFSSLWPDYTAARALIEHAAMFSCLAVGIG